MLVWTVGGAVTIALLTAGDRVTALVELAFFLLLGAALSPLPFPPSSTERGARGDSRRDGRPVVHWRPGCRFCLRLRLVLWRDAGRVHWVNIWRDPEGAAAVRDVTGGDETVPTVTFPQAPPEVNPDPRRLRARLRAA